MFYKLAEMKTARRRFRVVFCFKSCGRALGAGRSYTLVAVVGRVGIPTAAWTRFPEAAGVPVADSILPRGVVAVKYYLGVLLARFFVLYLVEVMWRAVSAPGLLVRSVSRLLAI
jgi:hypothetical protein